MHLSSTSVPRPNTFGEPLVFKKTGKEIIEKSNDQINKLQQKIESVTKDATDLCGKYHINLDQAVAEEERNHEDDDGYGDIQPFSNSAFANVTVEASFSKTKDKAKDLQEDIEKIQRTLRKIIGIKQQINEFKLLAAHLEPDRFFDLSYYQLTQFGFLT